MINGTAMSTQLAIYSPSPFGRHRFLHRFSEAMSAVVNVDKFQAIHSPDGSVGRRAFLHRFSEAMSAVVHVSRFQVPFETICAARLIHVPAEVVGFLLDCMTNKHVGPHNQALDVADLPIVLFVGQPDNVRQQAIAELPVVLVGQPYDLLPLFMGRGQPLINDRLPDGRLTHDGSAKRVAWEMNMFSLGQNWQPRRIDAEDVKQVLGNVVGGIAQLLVSEQSASVDGMFTMRFAKKIFKCNKSKAVYKPPVRKLARLSPATKVNPVSFVPKGAFKRAVELNGFVSPLKRRKRDQVMMAATPDGVADSLCSQDRIYMGVAYHQVVRDHWANKYNATPNWILIKMMIRLYLRIKMRELLRFNKTDVLGAFDLKVAKNKVQQLRTNQPSFNNRSKVLATRGTPAKNPSPWSFTLTKPYLSRVVHETNI